MKFTITLALIILLGTNMLYACDCESNTDKTKEDFDQEWQRVDYIMEVKITKLLHGKLINPSTLNYIGKDSSIVEVYTGEIVLEAQVQKIHKGAISTETIKIHTVADGGAMCQYNFDLNESYLFYGYQNEESKQFETTICHRTAPLSKSGFDLRLLKEKG